MTTDGSPPSFYKDGLMDKLIKIAIDNGVQPIDAYMMASYNPAVYYQLDHKLGMIAPGRIAHLNIIKDESQPTPISVIAKGQWVLKDQKPLISF